MIFHLSEEQELIQDSIRATAEGAAAARRHALETGGGWPETLWSELMALGLGGVMLSGDVGGSELSLVDAALALETIGETAAPGPYMAQILAGLALRASAVPGLAEQWLPGLASGEVVGAVALAETWAEVPSRVIEDEGLVGRTGLFLGGPRLDVAVVALADGDLALVEVAGAGVLIEGVPGSDPTRPLMRLTFDHAACTRLGAGAGAIARLEDAARVLLAADALGGASRCLALSVDYAKTRVQFGRTIGSFQAVKHQLADMALEIEPCRALLWYAAHAWDTEAEDAGRACALAKAHLADRFMAVARAAVEVHGGIGYTWEYDLQIWFRRALFDVAYFGSPAFQRERAAVLAGW